ncbi:helix-turn-helix domain-containing protein [Streptomyces sp. NPDC101062]|uniref:helix-turn-helix domain-containing protein n=1 Tax=unclassified Streptomyces TaxID=2593676 RepID=UPI0037F781E7
MTTPEQRPLVSRRQLGAELARLRTAKGLALKDVAEFLGTSPTRAGRLESGKGRVTPRADEIVRLCELYGVESEAQVGKLLGMLPAKRQPGWWDPYREALPSGLEVLLELETEAHSERAWEPVIVHGLLQTPDYARAILRSDPSTRPSDVDDLVEARIKRQELLTTSSRAPLNLWVILDESVVNRPVGGPDVMKRQIDHMIATAELPNVTLQIVPLSKGAHPGMAGAFSLLDFEGEQPPVVYVDSVAGNLYLEKTTDLRKFTGTFDLLRALAADPHESVALLKEKCTP